MLRSNISYFLFQVKVGTELDESLYDPNEVVLNAKKFDSLYKNAKFDSIDDIDKIVGQDETTDVDDKKTSESEQPVDDSKKSYTNTINSKEFREYLKNKGLLLFPTLASKSSESKLPVNEKTNTLTRRDVAVDRASAIDAIAEDVSVDVNSSDKKKTVLSRLSSIFAKKKTTPKSPEITAKHSFEDDKVDNGSIIKRVVLERRSIHNDGNRPVLANNEFLTSRNFLRAKNDANLIKANMPQNGIPSKPLNGEDEAQPVDRRNQLIRKNNNNPSAYRNIDLNRSKLYASMREPLQKSSFNEAPSSIDNLQPCNVIQRPQPRMVEVNQTPHTFKRNELSSSDKMAKNNSSLYDTPSSMRTHNYNINNVSNTRMKENSPNTLKNSEIDPFTFAKIQEIKKKTDEVLLAKQFHDEKRFSETKPTNQNFVRNSAQRSTIDGYFQERTWSPLHFPKQISTRYQPSQAPRSQSVLDNMTSFKDSLYGEVTYRQPNSSQDVNVIMRRPSTSTLDKKQIMDKIYDYYRKSVDNSPVPFQKKNFHFDPKSKDSSKTSTLEHNGFPRRQNVPQGLQERQNNLNMTPTDYYSQVSRSSYGSPRLPTVSDSDSEFAADSISSRDNYARYIIANNGSSTPIGNQSYRNRSYDQHRIYDVVNSSPVPYYTNGPQRIIYKYASPVPPMMRRPDSANSNHNQIYKAAPKQEHPQPSRFPPQIDYSNRKYYLKDSIHKPSALKLRDVSINNFSRKEAGNLHAITPNHYYGKYSFDSLTSWGWCG